MMSDMQSDDYNNCRSLFFYPRDKFKLVRYYGGDGHARKAASFPSTAKLNGGKIPNTQNGSFFSWSQK